MANGAFISQLDKCSFRVIIADQAVSFGPSSDASMRHIVTAKSGINWIPLVM